MPEFKTREEYERWKAEKVKIKDEIATPSARNDKFDAPSPPSSPARGEGIINEIPRQIPHQMVEQTRNGTSVKKCPYCFTEMDQRASVCPACKKQVGRAGKDGVAYRYHGMPAGIMILGIFVFLALIGLIGNALGPDKESRPDTPNNEDAYYMARQSFEKLLKAPATARFASYDDSSIVKKEENQFAVSSYVDSQNSFGAFIRTNFTCELEYKGNDRWKVLFCLPMP